MAHKKTNTMVLEKAGSENFVTVWTDACKRCIESLAGVAKVNTDCTVPHRYDVMLDPRYDRESVLKDLRAL